jgi:hypothetical protein
MRALSTCLAWRGRPRRGPASIWLVAAVFAALGASPPEVVRVRVPSDKISNWFPPGSDLHVLPYDRFEALVKAARERPSSPLAPRLLKARHEARWESERLIGRTELTVDASPGVGAGLLILEPWTPALLDRGAGAKLFRATPDGRLGLKVDPAASSKTVFEWSLRARRGSDGRAFAFDLPLVDVSSLSLDLPAGLVPEGPSAPRVGPEPGPSPGRSNWRFESARGRVDLRIGALASNTKAENPHGLWLEGTTTIDLGAGPVNWRADWTLDQSPGAPHTLTIGLDPGLEVVEVAGPRLASFRLDPDGAGSKVAIKLDAEGVAPTPLMIRAICKAPVEGTWSIPSARPLDASWTGGETHVRLDSVRVLQSCQEGSGRRVPPRSGDPAGAGELIFEPLGGQGPLAELTFRQPMADATVEVRGQLRLEDDTPRIEVALTWAVEKGRLLSFAADLPPGWTPEGAVSGPRQPVPWHADPLSNGGTRVHLAPSLTDEASTSVTVTLSASARQAGVTGPLDLPRVRPAPGVRVVDEVWVATSDSTLVVRPILGNGLAWLDPPEPALDDLPNPWSLEKLEHALAWRWLAEGAEARIDRTPTGADPRGEVQLVATIRGRRLALDWTIDVESPRGTLDPVPVHFDEPVDGMIAWKTREAGGPIVETRPMDASRRASLGFPASGQASDLVLSGPAKGKVELLGRVKGPWGGRGRLPILTLPARYKARGIAEVVVEKSTRVNVDSTGLTPIVPSSPIGETSDEVDEVAPSLDAKLRTAGVYAYRAGGGRLVVETTDAPGDSGRGLIREAFLVSQVSPGAGMRHRLSLGIATDSARTFSLVMPRGVTIDRLRRDGLAVAPIPGGGKLLLDIPAPLPGHPLSSLTVEYRTADDPRSGPIDPSRLLPECSLPCLSFAWELIAPDHWLLEKAERELKATDPRPIPSLATRLLGFHWSPWVKRDLASSARAEEGMLRDLDKVAADIADGETNLGEWFLKLDAGRRPLVLDRLAIRSFGWGPGSRIGPRGGESELLGPARSVLEPMGLIALPLAGMILITARDEVPDRPEDLEAWAEAIRAVPSEDSDRTDRFQSASRWQGEATPRVQASGESLGLPNRAGGWLTWRVVSNGWPPAGASISLVDVRFDRAWGWFVAAIVLVAGLLSRRCPATVRAIGLASVGVVAIVGLAWHWPATSSTFSGLLRGLLGVLAFWIGRSFRPIPTPSPINPSEASTTSRRSALRSGLSIAPVLAFSLGVGVAFAGSETEAPILALLPFDGPADPASKPDRAVMLVKDYERLEVLARRDDPKDIADTSLVSASHKVGLEAPGLALVESTFEIEVTGLGRAYWTLPVGPALELHAEVDDRPASLSISPDGASSTLTLEGLGIHRVRFRRLIPLSPIGRGGERARVPINRAAFARVSVGKGAGPSWVEVVGALGEVSVDTEGISGGLGPVGTLEVRWFPENRQPAPGFQGSVEATFLWDARPVGDLIRMKLVHSDLDGAPAVRIAMEPGVAVRRYSIPGVVSVRLEGTRQRPEWVAHLDPPLPKDVPIEVEFWRPAAAGSDKRHWPAIDVATPGKFTGVIGFRRPSDWSGRLEPGGGIEPALEASFAKAWGTLPDDGLTLAGATRLIRSSTLEVETKPVPPRRTMRTRLVAGLAPGRLNASIEGVLTDRQGRSFDLEVAIPNDLRLVRVEADGLLDWQRIARDRLRLQFDGTEVPERKVRLEAYVPVSPDLVMSEIRAYQTKIPWPRWADAETSPGTIEIVSPARFQFEPGEGTTATPVGPPMDSDIAFRSSYRVDRSSGPSTVRWSAPPAKVNVAVDTELSIDPSSLTWTAVLTCEVSGGPASSLNLNLPTAWAEGASLEIEGQTHRLVSQANGPKGETTHWTILPDSPIWGSARLILRSRRPLQPGREFLFPQVAPLATTGRGSVGRFDLAIRNGSGWPIEIAGSSGLQPVDASRLHTVDSFSTDRSSRSIDHAYHVTGERWSLRLRIGRVGDEASSVREVIEARVAFAQLTCRLDEAGAIWGRARFELEPRSGPFLAVRLPERAEIPWASVDGAIVSAFPDKPGRWLIPLGDRRPRRVTFAWYRAGTAGSSNERESVVLPTPDHPAPTTLISVDGPANVDFAMAGDVVERIGRVGWEVENIEQLSRRVVEALGNLDRSSRRDREAILDDLTEIELRGRHVSRLPAGKDTAVDPTLGRLQAALNLIVEASQAAGLDGLIQEARVRVGIAQADDESALGLSTAPSEVVRLRRAGEPRFFRFSRGESRQSPTITRGEKTTSHWSGSAGSWAVVATGLGFWVIVGALIARGIGPKARLAAALVLLTILAWEPVGLFVALGLIAWGRLSA